MARRISSCGRASRTHPRQPVRSSAAPAALLSSEGPAAFHFALAAGAIIRCGDAIRNTRGKKLGRHRAGAHRLVRGERAGFALARGAESAREGRAAQPLRRVAFRNHAAADDRRDGRAALCGIFKALAKRH